MAEEKDKPLTREDVLRLIAENGGKAEGLDLSGKRFEEGVDLRGLNLKKIILKRAVFPLKLHTSGAIAYVQGAWLQESNLVEAQLQKANLFNAQLQGANLMQAHLQKAHLEAANLERAWLVLAHLEGAILIGAHLQKAHLAGANLKAADLSYAHLKGAILADRGATLADAEFSPDTKLENVYWGNYILGEEKGAHFYEAAASYRRLKQWYTNAGMYDTAGKFFYREMTAKRKGPKWWPNPLFKMRQTLYWLLCGYGERPWQVFASAAVVIFGLAGIYFFLGAFSSGTFAGCLYYSAVSFTALGYGSWAPEPTGWVKGLGAFEAFMGVFMMALFLITFVRKMTR